VIAAAAARKADQFICDGLAAIILKPRPVAANEFGAARADEIGAVIVEHKEIAVLSVEHAREDLGDLFHRGFVIGGRTPIDVHKGGAGDGEVILEFGALGLDQLRLECFDLAFRQLARLQRDHD